MFSDLRASYTMSEVSYTNSFCDVGKTCLTS